MTLICKNCVVQHLSNLTHFNMQNLSSNEIFSEVISKKFWLLYYSFPWAGNSPNLFAFAYWVHRKRKYIDEALLLWLCFIVSLILIFPFSVPSTLLALLRRAQYPRYVGSLLALLIVTYFQYFSIRC